MRRDLESNDEAGAAYLAYDGCTRERPTMSDVACCASYYRTGRCRCAPQPFTTWDSGQGGPRPVDDPQGTAPDSAVAAAGSAPEPAAAHSLTDGQ